MSEQLKIVCPISGANVGFIPNTEGGLALDSPSAGGRYWIASEVVEDERLNNNEIRKKLSVWILKENWERNITASTPTDNWPKIYSSTIGILERQPMPSIEERERDFLWFLNRLPKQKPNREPYHIRQTNENSHTISLPIELQIVACCDPGRDFFNFIKNIKNVENMKRMPDGRTIYIYPGNNNAAQPIGQKEDNPTPSNKELNDTDDWEPLPIEQGSEKLAEAINSLTATIEAIREDNGYAANKPDERKAVLSEAEAGKKALEEQDQVFKFQIRNLVRALRKAAETFISTTILGVKIALTLNAIFNLTKDWLDW